MSDDEREEEKNLAVLGVGRLWTPFFGNPENGVSPDNEFPLFACTIEKIKIHGFSRERHLLITSRAIYSFAPESYSSANRIIMLHDCTGIVQSASSDHILIQTLSDYDFHMCAANLSSRQMIVKQICMAYAALDMPEPYRDLIVVTEREAKLEKLCVRPEHVQLKTIVDKRLSYKQEASIGSLPLNYEEPVLIQVRRELCDYLEVRQDKSLVEFLHNAEGQGEILFSEEVGKINQSGLYQSRFFVVTDTNIYNFKDRDFSRAQRVIPIRRLDGVVISSKSKEVVLQVHFEHDYHLDFTLPRSKQRDAFVNIVIQRYQSICGYRLLPQFVDDDHLEMWVCKEDTLHVKEVVEKISDKMIELARIRCKLESVADDTEFDDSSSGAVSRTRQETSIFADAAVMNHAELWESSTHGKAQHGLLVRELPIFACKIKKFNSDNKMDKRNILITDRAFYNFKPNDLFGSYPEAQRMIPLKQLFALVVSTSSEELMLYCLDQYDYRLLPSTNWLRKQLVEAMTRGYAKACPDLPHLPIIAVEDKNLSRFICPDDFSSLQVKRSLHQRCLAERNSIIAAKLEAPSTEPRPVVPAYDFLLIGSNQQFLSFLRSMSKIELETSTVYFSANMYKINRNRLKQLRCFVVTAKAIYNFKSSNSFDEVKRIMYLKNLDGIVFSQTSQQVVLQFVDEADYFLQFAEHTQCEYFIKVVAFHFETIASRSLPVTESFESDLSSQCCYETDLHKKLLSRRVSIKILNAELASIGIHKAAAASAVASAVVEEIKPEEPKAVKSSKSLPSDGPAAPAHFVRTQAASDLERQMRQKTAAVRLAASKGTTVSAVAPPRMVPIPPPAPEPVVPQAPLAETPKIAPRANVARPSPAGGAVASMLQRKAAFQSVMNSVAQAKK